MVVRTQCTKGSVNALYAIGRELMELGLVSGLDMTIECAITKMSYLFGNNIRGEEFTKAMTQDLRGEVTDIIKPTFSGYQDNFIKAISDTMKISTEYDGLKEALYPTIMCYAADFGYISVLEEMKKIGANFDSGDYEGRTPLHVAAKKGQVEVINYLIEQRNMTS
jgi:60kDa lysophospholipase